jgi:putative hemolysin
MKTEPYTLDNCEQMDGDAHDLINLETASEHPFVRRILSFARKPIESLLYLDRLNQCYARYYENLKSNNGATDVFQTALKSMDVRYAISTGDLKKIPASGPLVVVANHPFGGLEGVIIGAMILQMRSDLKIIGNFLLKRIKGIGDYIIPVDPFDTPGSARENLIGLKNALKWVKSGGVLAIFPAGEVASFKIRNRKVVDPDWSHHVAGIIRHTHSSVLPVYFPGRNSLAFQLWGLLHPRLRTALLPRELLNKSDHCIRPLVGKAIPFRAIKKYRSDKALIDYLRLRTYFLKNRNDDNPKHFPRLVPGETEFEAPAPIIAPLKTSALTDDLSQLTADQQLKSMGKYSVFIAQAEQIPHILKEIGRLREVTFRDVHEGTGRSVDLDRFDKYYLHLFLWNHERRELVGAYRLGMTDVILERYGSKGLYTNQLFRFKPELLKKFTHAIEIGRSFIRLEYQKKYNSLMLLWRGIGAFVTRNPRYHTLFGPVSISNDYHTVSRNLMVRFLKNNRFDNTLSRLVSPRRPYRTWGSLGVAQRLLQSSIQDIDDVSLLISELEKDGKGIPILLRQYLKLNGNLICFNVDRAFSDVVDGLLVVDLRKTDARLLKKFMGKEGFAEFAAIHGPPGESQDRLDPSSPFGGGQAAA